MRHGDAADLQQCAQALCLEEMFSTEITHGFVWYGGPRRREQVEFTAALRQEVRDIIAAIRTQLLTVELPEAPNNARSRECQLLHHCLPDLASSPLRVNRYIEKVVFRCDT